MTDGFADKKTESLKDKARHELIEYGLNVIYLALVFASFTVYRRLILATHGIAYENYGVALIEAAVLGKVIMIGGVFHLGRGLEAKPLIYPTLYKTFLFIIFVGIFKVIEHAIKGLWDGVGLMGGIVEYSKKGLHEVLAYNLVVFVALIPFFAVKELGRVLGKETVWTLFFHRGTEAFGRRRSDQESHEQ
jgi:hypothetical protein